MAQVLVNGFENVGGEHQVSLSLDGKSCELVGFRSCASEVTSLSYLSHYTEYTCIKCPFDIYMYGVCVVAT